MILKILSLLFLGSVALANGGEVANSGGFAVCSDGRMYSYDVLLTAQMKSRDRQVLDLKQDLQFIYSQLVRLQDPLAPEFKEFFRQMYQQNKGSRFIWFLQKGLPLMYEPEIDLRLPAQCKTRKQAVIFFAMDSNIPYSSYKYDPDLLAQVSAQPGGPLQVSYLWVHEWLWNHFAREGFITLAQFNRLLHSEALATMSPQDYQRLRPAALSR